MMIRKNSLVLAAAFTGLLGGTMGRLNATPFQQNPAGAQRATDFQGVAQQVYTETQLNPLLLIKGRLENPSPRC
jgi:hypothetical protein